MRFTASFLWLIPTAFCSEAIADQLPCRISWVCDGRGACEADGRTVSFERERIAGEFGQLSLTFDGITSLPFPQSVHPTWIWSDSDGDEEAIHSWAMHGGEGVVWNILTRTPHGQRTEIRFLNCDFPTGHLY